MLKKIFKTDDPNAIRPAKVVGEDDLQGWEAVGWQHCFDRSFDAVTSEGSFRCYMAGDLETASVVWVLLHGAGHCALVWSLVAHEMKTRGAALLAYDARGHGETVCTDEKNLSRERQALDCLLVMDKVLPSQKRVCLVGHSMGGSIAIAAAAMTKSVAGVVVLDVVEGTAMASLATIRKFVNSRPISFSSGKSSCVSKLWSSLVPKSCSRSSLGCRLWHHSQRRQRAN